VADFGDIIFWGLVWLYVLKLLTGNKPKVERAPPLDRPPARRPPARVAAGRPVGTQQEGTLLEQFLRQLEEAQTGSGPTGGEGGPLGRRSRTRLEGAEEVEERESLEAEEQIENFEAAPLSRRQRVEVDQDDAAGHSCSGESTPRSQKPAAYRVGPQRVRRTDPGGGGRSHGGGRREARGPAARLRLE
jgi:hypothetical protein